MSGSAIERCIQITENQGRIPAYDIHVKEARAELAELREALAILDERCRHIWCSYCEFSVTLPKGPTKKQDSEALETMRTHFENCEKHPLHILKAENADLRERLEMAEEDARLGRLLLTLSKRKESKGCRWRVDRYGQLLNAKVQFVKGFYPTIIEAIEARAKEEKVAGMTDEAVESAEVESDGK